MLNANTLQLLERNPDEHHHERPDLYCMDCILLDFLRTDFRVHLALLVTIELEKVARLREAADGQPWRDFHWRRVLCPARLELDVRSGNPNRRAAAKRAQRALRDFLFYRTANKSTMTLPTRVAREMEKIEDRTCSRLDELKDEGEPILNVDRKLSIN